MELLIILEKKLVRLVMVAAIQYVTCHHNYWQHSLAPTDLKTVEMFKEAKNVHLLLYLLSGSFTLKFKVTHVHSTYAFLSYV